MLSLEEGWKRAGRGLEEGWKSRLVDNAVTFAPCNGSAPRELRNARASFEGHTQMTPWDKVHAIYFCSYAL